jgi:hypothetical protein
MQHLGHTLTFDGETVACIPAAMRDSALRNRDQAFRETYDNSVVIVTADASISPRDTVTYAGATRRVLDTAATGDGLQTILHLGKHFGSP